MLMDTTEDKLKLEIVQPSLAADAGSNETPGVQEVLLDQ